MFEILEAGAEALTRNYFLRIIKARLMPHRGADWTLANCGQVSEGSISSRLAETGLGLAVMNPA